MTVKVKICVKNLYQVKTPTIRKSKKWEKQLKQWSHYKSGFLQNLNNYTSPKGTSPKGQTILF